MHIGRTHTIYHDGKKLSMACTGHWNWTGLSSDNVTQRDCGEGGKCRSWWLNQLLVTYLGSCSWSHNAACCGMPGHIVRLLFMHLALCMNA